VSDPLRYGLIGAGLMGLEHQRNLNAIPDALVVAAADPCERSLRHAVATAEGRPIATFADHRDLIAADLCDVYVIATPNGTHRSILEDVMATGRAVLVEKPLATTVADAAWARDAAEGYPSPVWVGLEYRYMPPIRRSVQLAADGRLGDVRMVAIREHRHPFLSKVGDWNRFNRLTGGTLVEKCCHFFDLMRLITQSPALTVSAVGGQAVNHLDERYDGEVPDIIDHALVVVEFASGAVASLDLCMFAEGTVNNEELSIVGTAGKVEAFLPSGEVRLGDRAGWGAGVETETVRDDRALVEGFHHGASYLEHLDLISAIRRGAPASVTADDGYWSVLMGVAAQAALAGRRVVRVAELAE
jgi:myo-inositol 2-dehydrogenase / D-chiro-inositol 1-dehydrogenase